MVLLLGCCCIIAAAAAALLFVVFVSSVSNDCVLTAVWPVALYLLRIFSYFMQYLIWKFSGLLCLHCVVSTCSKSSGH